MADQDATALQRRMLAALQTTLGSPCSWHETHISWVLVAGAYAYKFKKAVHFDFVDFSSLALRRRYCEEELRLNAKLAPDIYLEVVVVTGDVDHPELGGDGTPIEYAVKMRAFDQQALWSHRVPANLVSAEEIDGLAVHLAQFHEVAPVAGRDRPWCTPEALQSVADETIAQLERSLPDHRKEVEMVRNWEYAQRGALNAAFIRRRESGRIRECHGDLHCGNIVTLDGKVEAFDCIEFNDSLRWIDVMNDVAFACMDLRFRGHGRWAARLLSRYLEATGDYDGLQVLRYYEVHRALIRCKVLLLLAEQSSGNAGSSRKEALSYLSFAMDRISARRPAILITHGFSGSGKSTVARKAVEQLDAIQLRSDVERKRLHGMDSTARTGGIYTQDATARTYERLRTLASMVMQSGWTAVVDATFLQHAHRRSFAELAEALGVPFLILDVQTDVATMRSRIVKRMQEDRDASDANLAILERQLSTHDRFSADEIAHVVPVDGSSSLEKVRERLT